jgi:hypothetical protein
MTPKSKANVAWIQHEIFELIKQASAVVVAIVTLGGFIVTAWSYFGWWVPLSVQQHAADIKGIKENIDLQYNQLKRETLSNRIEVLQMRVTNLLTEIHNIDDAIAVHERNAANSSVSVDDKEVSKRRIVTLKDNKDTLAIRLRAVYVHMGKLRDAMLRLPYDPRLGEIEEYKELN